MKGRTELEFWRIENRFESAQKKKKRRMTGGELVAAPTNPPVLHRVRGERERKMIILFRTGRQSGLALRSRLFVARESRPTARIKHNTHTTSFFFIFQRLNCLPPTN